MYYSIPFQKIIRWLPNADKPLTIDTLGHRSYIKCYKQDNHIIAIGSTGKLFVIDKYFWDDRCKALNHLSQEERKHGKLFTNCKNRNFGPTVPALCRAYCDDNNSVNKDCLI